MSFARWDQHPPVESRENIFLCSNKCHWVEADIRDLRILPTLSTLCSWKVALSILEHRGSYFQVFLPWEQTQECQERQHFCGGKEEGKPETELARGNNSRKIGSGFSLLPKCKLPLQSTRQRFKKMTIHEQFIGWLISHHSILGGRGTDGMVGLFLLENWA